MNDKVSFDSCSECNRRTLCFYVVSDDPYCGADICLDCMCFALKVPVPAEYIAKVAELTKRSEALSKTELGRRELANKWIAEFRDVMGWPSKAEEAAALEASMKHRKCTSHCPFYNTEGRRMPCPTCLCECTECRVGPV